MTTTTQKMTAEQLLRLPRGEMRHELLRGELNPMAPAGGEHGRLAMRIGWRLAQYVEANGLGEVFAAETGFKIQSDPDTVRALDVAFVCRERLEQMGEVRGFLLGAPDLVVEVVSPWDSFAAVEEKVLDWLEAGAGAVLVVSPPKKSVTVYRSSKQIQVLRGTDRIRLEDLIPGWSLAIEELFG